MERYKAELQTLRKILPIGIQQAIILLQHYKGNVALAEQHYKTDLLNAIIKETGADETLVYRHLQDHNYDLSKTLMAVEQDQYTLTERIFVGYCPG